MNETQPKRIEGRTLAWWSAGAASSVACKLALAEADNVAIYYCDTGAEHEDNVRFRLECAQWYDAPIEVIRSDKYDDIWDVFAKTGWLVGPRGARCTTELKKNVRRQIQRAGDLQVFGFTVEEQERANRFEAQNPDVDAWFPLIERKLTKADCLAFLREANIALPKMYELGYRNNNCIGCVKGGMGYWNKIRKDFPEVFARMSRVERELDVAILKRQKNGKRVRVFLDELEPDAGRYEEEPEIECGVGCMVAFRDAVEES